MSDGNGTSSGIQAAVPTVSVGGRDEPSLTQGMVEMCVREDTLGLYRCEARFGNWGPKDGSTGFLYFGRDEIDFGKDFQVKFGPGKLFDGRITALEGVFPEGQAPQLTVLAEDRFQDLRMTRRTRQFNDVTDADIIRQVASDHGLRPDLDLHGPTHKVVAQVNLSDLAFIRERARGIDAEVWVDGTILRAQSRADRNGGNRPLSYGNDLREFTVLADLATQRTAVAVNGWDVAGKQAVHYEADEASVRSELNGDVAGAAVLAQAIGRRKEAFAHTVPLTSQDAQAQAEAAFRRMARRFVRGRGVAQTNPGLRVGATVDLRGLGALFNGKYYLAEVKHVFDAAGLRTEFVAERPGLGRPG